MEKNEKFESMMQGLLYLWKEAITEHTHKEYENCADSISALIDDANTILESLEE